jgi:hypothetical protein
MCAPQTHREATKKPAPSSLHASLATDGANSLRLQVTVLSEYRFINNLNDNDRVSRAHTSYAYRK